MSSITVVRDPDQPDRATIDLSMDELQTIVTHLRHGAILPHAVRDLLLEAMPLLTADGEPWARVFLPD
jgi:hypothetical protein